VLQTYGKKICEERVRKLKTLVILQPGYIPWLGFFDQMRQADVFVVYDDVAFDKNGWRNRNRIRTKDGWIWLTVPTHYHGRPPLSEVLIDDKSKWKKKHIGSLSTNYASAPFFKRYFGMLSEIIMTPYEKLLDLDMAIIMFVRECLGIKTPILFSSKLSVSGHGEQRLIDICKELDVQEYLSGDAGSDYINPSLFNDNNIKLRFHNYKHPEYDQDVLFNCGGDSLSVIVQKMNHAQEI